MRLVANKDIRLRTPGLNHNPQQRVEIMNADGIYEYSDEELAGYLSPGESTYRIQAGLLDLVIKAAHAEMPNTTMILAKQEAYDKVIQSSEDMLAKQRQDYQAQCDRMLQEHKAQGERMAVEHQRCMEQMRKENEEMLAEAARMRQEYARSVLLNHDPSIEDVTRTQTRYYDEDLEKQLSLRARIMGKRYEAEKQKRQRRDEELREAEERIEQLQKHLSQLEDIMDAKSKRALPARTQEDSPELHATKKTRTGAETLTLGGSKLSQGGNLLDTRSSEKEVSAVLQLKEAAPRSESSRSSSTSSRSDRSSSKEPSSDSMASNQTRMRTSRPTAEDRAIADNNCSAVFRGYNRNVYLDPSGVNRWMLYR
jgi:hypothetical protein